MIEYITNCTQCKGKATCEGESSTYVGYISEPGHNHDDNARTRTYVCESCGIRDTMSIINVCPNIRCNWTGDESHNHNGHYRKVRYWPAPYSTGVQDGSLSFEPIIAVETLIKNYLEESCDTRTGFLERMGYNILVHKQQMYEMITLLLASKDFFTDPDDLRVLYDAVRSIHAVGGLNLKLVHDHGLFELVEEILLDKPEFSG